MSPPVPVRRLRHSRALVCALGFVAATVTIAGCIPAPPPPPGPLTPMTTGVTHTLTTRNVTFVDTTRSTPAFDAYPGSPSRQLPTTIWYPNDGGGPFPLVVFAPGYGVTPASYAPLLTRIAASGYVVAAPTYPLLSGQPAGPTDTVGWDDLYGDTRFVTSEVLTDGTVGGLIDPDRIAVAGHSDGAALAFGDGFTPFKLDPRVRGVISYAADVGQYPPYQPNGRPFLHLLCDQDPYNPYDDAIAWDRSTLEQPKTVISLWNASHAGPFMDPSDPHFDLVVTVTIAWLDSVLKAHPEGMFFVSLEVRDHPSLAAME